MNLRELAVAIRSGELSPVDHVEDVLKRLEGDRCNAVVTLLAEQALRVARERAEELAHGQWRGPLHGVAVAVKDLIDVEGAPTRCGSNVRRDEPPAGHDALAVMRLREAGAVVVAKTHTHEFAYGPTGDIAAEGPARNPHDLTRITGGSSSGSAAAVAAGYVPLALGTDTGCSVRTPAALCGVVGFKPWHGWLLTHRVFPLSETLDHLGVLASDTYAASVGYSALIKAPFYDAETGISDGNQQPDVRGAVIGRPTDPYWRAADPVISAAVDAAAQRLTDAGATVVEVQTPGVDELPGIYGTIVGAEAYTTHQHALATRPDDFQPKTAQRLLANASISATEYVNAQRARRRITGNLRACLAEVDAILIPTTPIRATPIGAEEDNGVRIRPALLSLTLPFNLTGWPAISVPMRPNDNGLPAGVQLVGVRFDEDQLLRLAATFEQCYG